MIQVPVWLVALGVACVAPFAASGLQRLLDDRLRRRTRALVERARTSGARGANGASGRAR